MQIADTDEKEIPHQIQLVLKAIEKEKKLAEEREKEKELTSKKGDLIEEMKGLFEVSMNLRRKGTEEVYCIYQILTYSLEK